MTYTPTQTLTFEEFLAQYGNDPRYELIDGELRDMYPTGPHESVSGKLAGRLYGEILRLNLHWTIPKNCLIRPPATEATALRPDVIVLDEAKLTAETLGKPKQPMLTVCQLVEDGYCKQRYLLGMAIQSTLFPELRLALEDVMP